MAALSLIKALGIKPDMVAGHSYGEYVALCAAGYYDFKNLMDISAERGKYLLNQTIMDKSQVALWLLYPAHLMN